MRGGRAALGVLAAGALALTACGSGDGGPTAVAPVATPSASGSPGSPSGSPEASSTGSPSATSATPKSLLSPAPPPGPTLPDGTTTLFPGHRVVAFYGPEEGVIPSNVLAQQSPDASARKLKGVAEQYQKLRPQTKVLPAFELIVTLIQGSPGEDGDYAASVDLDVVERYYKVARANGFLMVLDIQPGLSEWLPLAKKFEKYLKMPDVGLALDPEWKIKPGEKPLDGVGNTTAAEINEVSDYLAGLVSANNLPQKIFLLHQFMPETITGRKEIVSRPGLATVIHLDGFGTREAKLGDLRDLKADLPGQVNGFKLFLQEDINIFSPAEVLALKPAPEIITYQ